MKTKKSLLYWTAAIATGLTLIGIWTHLTTAFSVYEIKELDAGQFSWTFSGMVISSSISIFLILTAIGITIVESRIKIERAKATVKLLSQKLSSLNWFLVFCAFIEMYGNIYYSIAGHLDKPKFTLNEVRSIDFIPGLSIFMFSFTLTIISIVGSKLLSIFAVNDEPQGIKDNKYKWVHVDSERIEKVNEEIPSMPARSSA